MHADHGNQIKLCISLIRICMHEPAATIENEALFSGTRVIPSRSVSSGLKQSHVGFCCAQEGKAGRGRGGESKMGFTLRLISYNVAWPN